MARIENADLDIAAALAGQASGSGDGLRDEYIFLQPDGAARKRCKTTAT